MVAADAAEAAGEVVNATTSAKAAADINEECLRGLSAPAGSVTSEGGPQYPWRMYEFNGAMRYSVWIDQRYEVIAAMLRLGSAMTVCADVASAHAVVPLMWQVRTRSFQNKSEY